MGTKSIPYALRDKILRPKLPMNIGVKYSITMNLATQNAIFEV